MAIDAPDLGSLRLLSGASSLGAEPVRSSSQTDFASIMGIANRTTAAAGKGESGLQSEARDAAEAFVAKVFIEPILKQARESNKEPPPFGPGQGEKQFASLIDAQRSLDLVRSASWPIVDRLAADLTRNAESRSGIARTG